MITSELGSRGDPVGVMGVPGGGAATALALTIPNPRLSQHAGDECLAPRALNEVEMRERDQCETIIGRGWNTFLEVGRALSRIRQKRLYRDQYSTFEEYCREKWDFSKTHANRLIEAAAVDNILAPIGVKVKKESHVRALVWLSPQQIIATWQKAQELAGGGEVTARLIRQAAQEFKDDCICDFPAAPAKKPTLNRAFLKSTCKLIDRAEKAARKRDTQAVLDALADLRQRFLDY
ncbi:MAG: hypothetical protein ACREIC_08705 [Limisphaerales bacterium]